MIHSNSTPSTPAQKSRTLRGFPSMNFTRFHRKVTPSFFSASNSEASSSQTSLSALDTSSCPNARTTCSSSTTSSPAESNSDNVYVCPNSTADLVGRPIMDPKLLNAIMEGKDPAALLAKPTQPLLTRSKSAEPLVKSDSSQDFSPLSSRRLFTREDRFYRPDEHSDTEDHARRASSQSEPVKVDVRFPF